jgi:hypothetical protein
VDLGYKLNLHMNNTSNPPQDTAIDSSNVWRQIPPNGSRCPITGLTHARFYQLINGIAKSHVRTCSLKEPGCTRATRLVHMGDLLQFLNNLAQEQAEKKGDCHG